MSQKTHYCILNILLPLIILNLISCTSSRKKDTLPKSSKTIAPLLGIIYGRPIEIRESSIPLQSSKPGEDIFTFEWQTRKIISSSPFRTEYYYLGKNLRLDSSSSEDGQEVAHYLKTPFYQDFITYSRTAEQKEYYFKYDIDTLERQVWELKNDRYDTSSYTFNYFSRDGFLMHRFVKLTDKESYHLYYTNDNHGNPIKVRMNLAQLNGTQIDFIQEKWTYEYDTVGNWIVKDLYFFVPTDSINNKHIQYTRKISYSK